MLKPVKILLISALLVVRALAVPPAAADEQLNLIRDAEIENIIRAYATPLFTTAGLDPAAVNIYIVNDKSLNAFVAGGQNLFLNTGLLMRAENAGQVIGVIAHETGHIVGGHLTRLDDAIRRAQIESIVAFVLGAGAAILSGDGRAAGAIVGAGQDAAARSFFKYTRSQEQSADQFAVTLLDDSGISARGMLEFFKILEGQEFLVTNRQDPYVRTHPLTSARIQFVRNHVANSPYSETPLPPQFTEMHKRMRAKLIGFLQPTARVFQTYKADDTSLEARYARAIAYHRDAKLDESVELVDSLIAEHPGDPYFHELKGQILFESGRIREALPPYQEAVRLLPANALLRAALAAAQLETQDPALVEKALSNLEESSRMDPEVPHTWRLLATAYGRLGQHDMVSLSLAEEALLLNRNGEAKRLGKKAMEMLPKASPAWLRAQDVVRSAEKQMESQ